MAGFFQTKFNTFLMREPVDRVDARFDPPIKITPSDKIEIIGPEITEVNGPLTTVWVKTKSSKGEGFLKRSILVEFVEPAPPPDDQLDEDFRRAVDIPVFAKRCLSAALDFQSNSSLLLALAFAISGKNWKDGRTGSVDLPGHIGIYGFSEAKWREATAAFPGGDIHARRMTSSLSQCEVAAFVTGRDWKLLETGLGRPLTAIDLYLAFLTNAGLAAKCLKADANADLSTVLTADELAMLRDALAQPSLAIDIAAGATQAAIIAKLAETLDLAFDFVRGFAEELLAETAPSPVAELPRTEQEVDMEEEVTGPVVAGPESGTVVVTAELPAPSNGQLELTEAHLIGLWKRSMFPISDRGVIVFGIRGCLPVDSSGTDFMPSHLITLENIDYRKMRCTIGQWLPGRGIALFPGSTVPFQSLVEAAKRRGGRGVNQLGRGRYPDYVAGFHKRSESARGHWALLQECETTFQRTADDLDFDEVDRWDTGRPGDNIHCAFSMGVEGAIPDSKFSSAGCQVVAGTVRKGEPGSEAGPWRKFIKPFNRNDGQKRTEYVLFEGREVQQIILTHYAGKSAILRMGSVGEPVKQLQRRLSEKLGRTISADGKFEAGTFQAVIEFQQRIFGMHADDGIVGPETAAKLGFALPEFDFAAAISGGSGMAMPAADAAMAGASGVALAAASEAGPAGSPLDRGFFLSFAPEPDAAEQRAIHKRYLDYFTSADCLSALQQFGILDRKLRLAHFFAQTAQETGGFTLTRESLDYRTVNAVRKAFKRRSAQVDDSFIENNLLRNPVALGRWAYNGRLGNREDTDDGFNYRGGGIFQTTGRENYRELGARIGVDLGGNPSLIEDPANSMRAACLEWESLSANQMADNDQLERISRGINIGDPNSNTPANGEADRRKMLKKVKLALGI